MVMNDKFKVLTCEFIIERYYDPTLVRYCKTCPGYDANYACPPLLNNKTASDILNSYEYIHILPITLDTSNMSLAEAKQAVSAKKRETDSMLINMAAAEEYALALSCSKCDICDICARAKVPQAPCNNPNLSLLSLDALHIDIVGLCRDILSISFQWGDTEKPPERTTLLFALLTGKPHLSAR